MISSFQDDHFCIAKSNPVKPPVIPAIPKIVNQVDNSPKEEALGIATTIIEDTAPLINPLKNLFNVDDVFCVIFNILNLLNSLYLNLSLSKSKQIVL